ncbi:MAG: MFS transporter [Halanaerobiales bacterium]|nr:MFS transporter [Halanaerobiales bacterium]
MNNNKNNNKFNWKILIVITFAGFASGIYRNGIMTLFPFLQSDFNLSRAQVGLYSSFLFISMALSVIFAGRIADYFGVKKSIFWGLLLLGLFVILHSFANNFALLMLFATLSGLGLSIILPSTSKAVSEWFKGDNQATAMGIMTTGLAMGGVFGASFLPWLTEKIGWQMTITFLGILFFITSFLFYYFYKDNNKNLYKIDNKKDTDNTLLQNLRLFLTNKYLLMLCIIGIIFGVVSGIIVTHFSFFLYTDHNYSKITAGMGLMVLQIGSMFGRTGWSYLNNKFLGGVERKGFVLIGILSSIVILIFSFLNYFNPSLIFILFLAFMLGATGRGWHGLYFSEVSKQVGEENAGMGVGLALFFIRFGIIIGPPIFGLIADETNTYSYSWLSLSIIVFIVIIISNYFLNKYEDERINTI